MKRLHILAAALCCMASPVALSATAQAEKILNVGMAAADITTLDPHRAVSTQDKPVMNWVFNGLVRFKPGSVAIDSLEPDLAEKWESTPDKLTWTFHLRHGVQFQRDFGELTADDVVFSLERAANKDTSTFAADYANVESIKALDPYTVQIKLKQVVPGFLGLVANYQGGNIVSKKAAEKLGDQFRTMPVGTGPFEIKDYQPNQGVTLVANAKYFRGKPKIDGINYKFIPSDASRDLAFSSGELDLLYGRQDQKWVDREKEQPNTVVDVIRPAELAELSLNETKPPLDNLKVRQAVAYAIDRAAIAQFKGAATAEPAVSVVPAGYLGTIDAKLFPHDAAKAKELLKEAGFPNGITITAIQTSLPTMLNSMQIIQAQLKQAGINLELQVVDHQTFHAQIRKDLSMAVYYSAARFPVDDIYLTQFFHSRSTVLTPTAATNFSHCKVADQEIDQARIEPDEAKQKALWAAAQQKIVDDVCAVPLFEQLQVWAHHTNLHFNYDLKGSLNLGPDITEATTLD
ncbi:ABC transporter substrate-binding protein [Aliidongia dinghuensis]|uniref:ABC transporter substrate-binding protein n=1 Tax=Aliidongia dinghuensis TaxID=1867774 RepID=A0A8J2YV78_9PROT|nr:ABC transporter substrate-binding protein [Aliidongia dinghuensis]GGF26705.1 ABC transporter substrate-binding protein [Aliidongia dinghuensis]